MRKQITITHFEGPDLSMVRCHFQAGGVNETIIGVKAVIFFFFFGEWGINPRRTTSFFPSEIKISLGNLASEKKRMQLYVDGERGCVRSRGVRFEEGEKRPREMALLKRRMGVIKTVMGDGMWTFLGGCSAFRRWGYSPISYRRPWGFWRCRWLQFSSPLSSSLFLCSCSA